MKTEVKELYYFTLGKLDMDRMNEGLRNRNIDADSVISIIDNGDYLTVWYKK